MEIRPDLRLERLNRQRAAERAAQPAADGAQNTGRSPSSDAIESGEVTRYMELLRQTDPADLHRVQDIRARIADGSFTAPPEELVDGLLQALDGEDGGL